MEEDANLDRRDTKSIPLKTQPTIGIAPDSFSRVEHTISVHSKPQPALGISYNPFNETIASFRESDPGDDARERSAHRPMTSKPQNTSHTRTPLDVDAFKRMLLTGDRESTTASTPSTPSTHTLPLQGTMGDNSSNTDVSSLSRQSILEPQTEAHIETPRTSHEISPSDDELQRLVSAGSPTRERRGPTIPQTHNGRLVKYSSPERDSAVSRADDVSRPTTPTKQVSSSSARSGTDLNKPLPPPPPTIESLEHRAATLGISLKEDGDTSSISSSNPLTQKRVAPAPPLARRHSQLRSKYAAIQSGRSTPIAEEKLPDKPASVANKSPAPPPPAHRRGTDRSTASTDALSVEEISSPSGQSPMKAKPPLPPARTASSSSAKRPVRASPSASTAAMAPPPPPPRRRRSSASSYSNRRISGEIGHAISEDYSGLTPVQSTMNESAISSTGEKDIMADLSALQREVDALRGKYEMESTKEEP